LGGGTYIDGKRQEKSGYVEGKTMPALEWEGFKICPQRECAKFTQTERLGALDADKGGKHQKWGGKYGS